MTDTWYVGFILGSFSGALFMWLWFKIVVGKDY